MKAITTLIGAAALVLATVGMASANTTLIYSQDFESLNVGQLVGQDSWVSIVNGNPVQVGIGDFSTNGGSLDNMQLLPCFGLAAGGATNYVARPVGSLDPTKITTLTFDACEFVGGFGFGGSDGNYQAAIRFDNPDEAFDTRSLLGVSYPAGYDIFPFPRIREKFKIVVDGPNTTISAYYNDGTGNGYTLIGTQHPTVGQIAGLSTLALYSTGTGSNPGYGVDNIQLYTGTLPLQGDFNLDGHVNAADIKAMMGALADSQAYKTAHGLSQLDYTLLGDINQDGVVANNDLQVFINYLIAGSGSTQSVPEPSTLILFALGACAGLMLQRRRGELIH